MELEIISFGKIAEVIENQRLTLNGIQTTDDLKVYLEKTFPKLSAIQYKLAVNKNLIQENSTLKHNDLVAIMPPFSGG